MAKVNDYEMIRMNDGGEVRIWYDGVIDVLKHSPMTVGFRAAAERIGRPPLSPTENRVSREEKP